jgi:hypothetical protein
MKILYDDQTGTVKSKMAAAKLELHTSHLVETIARRFQRLGVHLLGRISSEENMADVSCRRKHEIEDDGC